MNICPRSDTSALGSWTKSSGSSSTTLRFRRRLEARQHVVLPTVQWRFADSGPLLQARAGSEPRLAEQPPPPTSPSIGSPAEAGAACAGS